MFVPPPQYEEEAVAAEAVAAKKKSSTLSFLSDPVKASACKELVQLLAVNRLTESEVISRVQWSPAVLLPVIAEVTHKDREGKLQLNDDREVWRFVDPSQVVEEHRPAVLETLSRLGLRDVKLEAALTRYRELRQELLEARARVTKVYSVLKKSPTKEAAISALQLYALLVHRVKAVVNEGNALKDEIARMADKK